MKNFVKAAFFLAVAAFLASGFAFAQQVKRADFDVTNYVMDVALSPVENKLTATADVTFIPLEDARQILTQGDPDSIFVETEQDLTDES